MSKRRTKPVQLTPSGNALVGRIDWASLGNDPAGDVRVFAGASSQQEVRQRLRTEVEAVVAAMLEAIEGCDAFDVIELMRLREIPIVPVVVPVGGHDGIAAVMDLVSVLCLSRPERLPDAGDRSRAAPHEVIDGLHDHAARLLRLATFMHMASAGLSSDEPLARLASEYQSYLIWVRNFRFTSVQEKHDEALFGRSDIGALLLSRLGFTFEDFATVRSAIQERYSRILTEIRDETGDFLARYADEASAVPEDEIRAFRASMSAFMFLPGNRASFTASDIASESGLEPARVEAVLDTFSTGFGSSRNAADAVVAFLQGVNPLARTCLIRDSVGNYLMTSGQIGTDSLRAIVEDALKPDSKVWNRYDRARAAVSENLALDAVSRMLGTPAAHVNLTYYVPKQGHDVAALRAGCSSPQAVAGLAECDGLFVIGDVAICVEVKGRAIAEPARRGDRARLATEIKKIFREGARQAQRIEELISRNQGLWLSNGTWLDLAGVREIRSVVAGLDDFGPLSVALGDLDRAGMLGEGNLPWIASLHDLEVISSVLERPAEFLLYLRRRTASDIAAYYRGADELDLFMLFLGGGLYIEEDPDEVRREHPAIPSPRSWLRARHDRDARPTAVGTFTDPLDAWMYWNEGTSPFEIDKPAFNAHPAVSKIVDFLADGRKPGWLRFGADLLSLSGTAQKQLGESLRHLADMTRADGRWHTIVQSYASRGSHPVLFAATRPRGTKTSQVLEQLKIYMTAKKHQMRSDRSLGLLVDERREFLAVLYMNDLPADDPGLDALGVEIGLQQAGDSYRPIPPSARRATRQLRGKRNRKR